MNLPYLDYFRAVAKYENMTKAAATLHVSQPALSQTINKLEDELGIALFTRTRGKLSLTVAGKLYYECVERAFAELERGSRQLQSFRPTQKESLTVVSTFPHLLCSLVNHYPTIGTGLTINPFIYSLEQSVSNLIHRNATFGLLPFCPPKRFDMENEILRQHKVFEEEILLIVGRDHPLAGMGTISLADLQREAFVVNEQNFTQESFLNLFAAMDYMPSILVSSNETRIINPFVSTGSAVYLSPISDVMGDMSEETYRREMVALQLQEPVTRAIFLSKLEDTILSAPAQQFYDHILSFFTQLEQTVHSWKHQYFSS